MEYFFSDKFSTWLSAWICLLHRGCHVLGRVKGQDFFTYSHFPGMPVHDPQVYGGFEGGLVIKGSSNTATLPALSPSVGVVLKKVDSNLRLTSVLGMPGYLENTFLKKGGYSYPGARIAYRWQ